LSIGGYCNHPHIANCRSRNYVIHWR